MYFYSNTLKYWMVKFTFTSLYRKFIAYRGREKETEKKIYLQRETCWRIFVLIEWSNFAMEIKYLINLIAHSTNNKQQQHHHHNRSLTIKLLLIITLLQCCWMHFQDIFIRITINAAIKWLSLWLVVSQCAYILHLLIASTVNSHIIGWWIFDFINTFHRRILCDL